MHFHLKRPITQYNSHNQAIEPIGMEYKRMVKEHIKRLLSDSDMFGLEKRMNTTNKNQILTKYIAHRCH